MCTRHKTWPQTQRLLPPSLTHHASCCLWVGFIFMPFCLSWQTGGSGVHRQHHCDHASSHQQQHHLISITIQSALLWSSHLHHCDHCIISSFLLWSLYLASASLWSCIISSTSLWSLHHQLYCDHFIISITVHWQRGYVCWRPWWRMMVGCDVVTLVIVTVIRQSIGDGGHGHGKQWVAGLGISWPMPTQDQLQNL